jgi:hypothetical protein
VSTGVVTTDNTYCTELSHFANATLKYIKYIILKT